MKWRPNLFITFNDQTAEYLVAKAKHRLILVAPSISLCLAKEIVAQTATEPTITVKVIIDPVFDALQLGYGELSGLSWLHDHGIDVRQEKGIRIGLLIADDRSWIFTPTPRIIEQPAEVGTRNALLISPEYTRWLLKAIAPKDFIRDEVFEDLGLRSRTDDPEFPADDDDDQMFDSDLILENDTPRSIEIDFEPEIGLESLSAETIEQLAIDNEDRPPREFDHEREVLVYNGYLQFVDLNFVGARLTARKVRLPDCLVDVAAASAARIEIEATCRLFENAERVFPDLKFFERRVLQLRKEYLVVLDEQLGSVILRKRWDEFKEKLDECSKDIKKLSENMPQRIETELKNSKARILDALVPALLTDPPPWLSGSDDNATRSIVAPMLDECFPDSEAISSRMELNCVRKDVTWEMLNSEKFGEAIMKAFPDEKFTQLYSGRKALEERTNQTRFVVNKDDIWPEELSGGDEDL